MSEPNGAHDPQTDRTWDWKYRKDPVYCRPHGHRILVFINGVGLCRKCVEQWIKKLQGEQNEKYNS
jgi:hypothetical protein